MNGFHWLLRLAAALCLVAGSARAQEHTLRAATIAGVVRDSATRQPVAGAEIVLLGRTFTRTDSLGVYALEGIPPGAHRLRLSCPSRTAWHAQPYSTIEIEVRKPHMRRDFQISLSRCTEPPFASFEGEFEGLHRSGFEVSQFVPCPGLLADPELAKRLGGRRIAMAVTDSARATYRALRGPPGDTVHVSMGHEPWVYVRVRGVLQGPGAYGHMGMSTYRMTAMEILEVGEPTPACPAPSRGR